jgi:hypothetical protein
MEHAINHSLEFKTILKWLFHTVIICFFLHQGSMEQAINHFLGLKTYLKWLFHISF